MKTDLLNSSIENVYFSTKAYQRLKTFLEREKPSKIFCLVDTNTHKYCLSHFFSEVKGLENVEIIEIEAGEKNKNIETCNGVWNVLSELGADRKSLLINIGGGVVTDLGGFVASTFMRGIKYINVPTTLLAMVDASVGGKTGVDLGKLKNQIGVINPSEFVIIDSHFLNTLTPKEMRSGLAEILKHGLIQSEAYWVKTTALKEMSIDDLDDIIYESIKIKSKVVNQDPNEEGLRKTLNFGHTIGHAIESFFLEDETKQPLTHGEAVAAGMIMACYISTKFQAFPEDKFIEISTFILSLYDKINLTEEDFEKIVELLKFDKKNVQGNINFVLLKNIGVPVVDCIVPSKTIFEAFKFYTNS